MVMKKTWFAPLLCAALPALSLLGCGQAADPAATAPSPEAEATTQTEAKAEGAASAVSGDLEIQYFVGGYGDAWWKEMIAEFTKAYPEVNVKESAGSKINEQMRPRWIQGNPPDLVYIDGAGANERQMVEDGQLMDLTEWLKTAKNVDGEPILDHVIAAPDAYDGGTYYSIPLVFGSWGTFYDAAWFEQNGWDAPTDYESFLAIGERIQATGVSPYIHTGMYPYYIQGGLLNPAIVSANGDDASILKDMAELKPGVFRHEAVARALAQLVELRDKGYIDASSIALNHTDSQIQWLQHKAAFIPVGLWLENEMKKDVPEGFEFGFVPSITQAKGGKYVASSYTNTIAIAKKAKNPEAAKAFIEFVFKKQAALRWAELTGALMNWKTDLDASQASDVVKSAMKFYTSDQTVVTPVAVIDKDVQKAIEDALVALLNGDITPEEWMERVEGTAEAVRNQ